MTTHLSGLIIIGSKGTHKWTACGRLICVKGGKVNYPNTLIIRRVTCKVCLSTRFALYALAK